MPGFTVLETLLSVLLTAIVSPMLTKSFVEPYWEFKKELIDTIRILNLHSNILSNFFSLPREESFIKKINDVQYDFRIKENMLSSTYFSIPKSIKWVLIKFKKIPSKQDMEYILPELIGISNSMILFNENNRDIAIDDLKNRKDIIPELIKRIRKYL
jgi:hypothetical protein